MRLIDHGDSLALWVSARDTEAWATKPGAAWPCSELRGRRLFAAFDTNGLADLTVDGKSGEDIPCDEFSALTSDLLAERIDETHPCYFVTVGQLRASA